MVYSIRVCSFKGVYIIMQVWFKKCFPVFAWYFHHWVIKHHSGDFIWKNNAIHFILRFSVQSLANIKNWVKSHDLIVKKYDFFYFSQMDVATPAVCPIFMPDWLVKNKNYSGKVNGTFCTYLLIINLVL